jgi:hypothetical protein
MPVRRRATRDVELRVPCDFELPTQYESADPTVVGEMLTIGASLYETVKAVRASEELRAAEEAKVAEIARVRAVADARIDELNAALARAEAEHAERTSALLEAQRGLVNTARKEATEITTQQYNGRLRALEADLEAAAEKARALAERRAVLEAGRDADIRVAEERTRALLQITLDEKERAIQRAERTLNTLQESFGRQTEELHALSDLIRRKPTNVKNKGTEYEAIFRDKLVAAYGTGDKFSLVDSARNGVGHAGDYLMTWGDHTVLWEVKNYDRPVPSAEVDKFRRDMKENAHVRVGVMVSRYTGITGHTARGDRDIEFREGKMLIYLSNFEAMSDDTLPFLLMLFRLWWESDRNAEEGEIMESTIRSIERLHAAAVKARTEWRLHRSRMDEALRWMSEQVEESETKLKAALCVLQGGGKVLAVPPGIFRDCDGDEKSQQLVQLVLEHTSIDEKGVCVLNDLADIVGRAKGLSRDTAKTHIRSVLLDSVIEPPKGKQAARIVGLTLRGGAIEHIN